MGMLRFLVPTRGFAGATVEGLVVAGRAIQVHPNTLDSLGPLGYLVALHGLFIDAPHTGDVIRISSFADPRWAARYMGAVRPY
ncbi:MAG: hypothetical protein M3Q31_08325 [Actinomycetota bacterium]|nr:hypothetical protein [Actinomycetota bacterium]